MKVSVIGIGRVGSALAFCLAGNKSIDKLVLVNRTKYRAEGLKMDLMGSFPSLGNKISVGGYSDVNDSDIVVLTAGCFGSPDGRSVYDVNKEVVENVFQNIYLNKTCKIIFTTTPVDEIALDILRLSELDSRNVIGFGGQLDVNRLKYLIYRDIGNFSKDIEASFIGVHGSSGIPVFRQKVSDRDGIIYESKNYFRLYLSKLEMSVYGTASELAKLVNLLMSNEERVVPVSYYDEEKKLFINWPCIVSKKGVLGPINLDLSEDEREEFDKLIKQRLSK